MTWSTLSDNTPLHFYPRPTKFFTRIWKLCGSGWQKTSSDPTLVKGATVGSICVNGVALPQMKLVHNFGVLLVS